MVLWVVAPCILVVGNQCLGGCAASIFRDKVCDQGDVYTALLPTQRCSWCTIQGIHGRKI